MYADGLPTNMSESQLQSIRKAMSERLTLIQGLPGTGKTTILGAIVTNWIQ